MVLATGLYGPTSVLGVHRIATYVRFFMLKKTIFILVPNFHGPSSWSDPVLRTMDLYRHLKMKVKLCNAMGETLKRNAPNTRIS